MNGRILAMAKVSGAVNSEGILSGMDFAVLPERGITFINDSPLTGAALFGVLVRRVRPSRNAFG